MRYPTELPIADMKIVFDFVRGNPNNLAKNVVIESGWWVVGYGAGIAFGGSNGFIPKSIVDTNKEIEMMLEPHVTLSSPEAREALPPIDWMKLIKLILTIIIPML